jgi:hypothetical protein
MTCHGQGHGGVSGIGLYGFEQCHGMAYTDVNNVVCSMRELSLFLAKVTKDASVTLLFKRPAEGGQDPQRQQIDAERVVGKVLSKSRLTRHGLFSQEILDSFLTHCRWKRLDAAETRANVEAFSFQQTPADAMDHARRTSALAHLDENTASGIRGGVPAVVLHIYGWRRRLSMPDPQRFDALRTEGWYVGYVHAFSPSGTTGRAEGSRREVIWSALSQRRPANPTWP